MSALISVRGLSVHFMLDVDGTIYQTCDAKERAGQATVPVPPSERAELDPMFAEMRRREAGQATRPATPPVPAAASCMGRPVASTPRVPTTRPATMTRPTNMAPTRSMKPSSGSTPKKPATTAAAEQNAVLIPPDGAPQHRGPQDGVASALFVDDALEPLLEVERIRLYQAKGDLASVPDVLQYLNRRDKGLL